MKHCKLVIGKNFGDEGKGLAVAKFASDCNKNEKCLVIKHNGGAQSGHTVETGGFRIVSHQIGSGAYEGADTFWADSYIVDLFKIAEEADEFEKKAGKAIGRIYVSPDCRISTIYDVLLNSIAESLRSNRHGSCGMGIYEATLRSRRMPFTIKDLTSKEALYLYLLKVKEDYVPQRLKEIFAEIFPDGKQQIQNEEVKNWIQIIQDENVAINVAEDMYEAFITYTTMAYGNKAEYKAFLEQYQTLIFETSQGLMLDQDNMDYYPHLTPSKTGAFEPMRIMKEAGVERKEYDLEVCYVTRSYVTRHGNGRLNRECGQEWIPAFEGDQTNIPNPWQSSLRFGTHGTLEQFEKYVKLDLEQNITPCAGEWNQVRNALFITHLNETKGCIITLDKLVSIDEYLAEDQIFHDIYCTQEKDYRKVD